MNTSWTASSASADPSSGLPSVPQQERPSAGTHRLMGEGVAALRARDEPVKVSRRRHGRDDAPPRAGSHGRRLTVNVRGALGTRRGRGRHNRRRRARRADIRHRSAIRFGRRSDSLALALADRRIVVAPDESQPSAVGSAWTVDQVAWWSRLTRSGITTASVRPSTALSPRNARAATGSPTAAIGASQARERPAGALADVRSEGPSRSSRLAGPAQEASLGQKGKPRSRPAPRRAKRRSSPQTRPLGTRSRISSGTHSWGCSNIQRPLER